jgi:hypothetical protein
VTNWDVTRGKCGVFEGVVLAVDIKQRDATSYPENGCFHKFSGLGYRSTICYISEVLTLTHYGADVI